MQDLTPNTGDEFVDVRVRRDAADRRVADLGAVASDLLAMPGEDVELVLHPFWRGREEIVRIRVLRNALWLPEVVGVCDVGDG